MCGGMGFVIGLIVFFAWKDSENKFKSLVAYCCAVAMAFSVVGWAILLFGY